VHGSRQATNTHTVPRPVFVPPADATGDQQIPLPNVPGKILAKVCLPELSAMGNSSSCAAATEQRCQFRCACLVVVAAWLWCSPCSCSSWLCLTLAPQLCGMNQPAANC
jgi:hypothetical protein